jgi:hypothetical protein
MNPNLSMKKAVLAVCLIAVAIVLICAVTLVSFRRGFRGEPEMLMLHADCASLFNLSSASYSATLVAKQDMDTAANTAETLIQKYHGDLTSRHASSESYRTGPSPSDSVAVSTITLSAMIPLQDADAFMKDMQNSAAEANNTLMHINYSKTTGDQAAQSCMENENEIQIARAGIKLYLSELPFILKRYAISTTTDISDLQDANDRIQSFYSQINSSNDSIAPLFQNANKVTISIIVQDRDNPVTYYPSNE